MKPICELYIATTVVLTPSVSEARQLCVFVCVASCYPDIWQENILLESSKKSGRLYPLPPIPPPLIVIVIVQAF